MNDFFTLLFALCGFVVMQQHHMQFDDLFIPPKKIRELNETMLQQAASNVEISPGLMPHFKVKVKPVGNFSLIWDSKNSGTRTKLSIWSPTREVGMFHRNKLRICVGYYPNDSFDHPGKQSGANARLLLEVSWWYL